jgi:hypothetical protein
VLKSGKAILFEPIKLGGMAFNLFENSLICGLGLFGYSPFTEQPFLDRIVLELVKYPVLDTRLDRIYVLTIGAFLPK